MRKLFSIVVALFLVSGFARAAVLFNSLITITTAQTNTATFVTNTAAISLPLIYVSNATSATNSFTGFFRWSFDNSTFYTNACPPFIPATTNGTTTIQPQVISVPVYIQMLAVTNVGQVGPVQVGAFTP